MAGEQDDQDGPDFDLEVTPEEDKQGDADFAAAFNTARSDAHGEGPTAKEAGPADDPEVTQPVDSAAQAEADAAAQAAAAAAEEDAPVTVSKKDFARIMAAAEQVTALQDELRTTKDKTFGKLGSLQQMVDGFKAQAAKSGPAMSAPQLKRLEAEFPELAKLLAEDMGDHYSANAAPATAEGDNPTGTDAEASGAAAPGAEVTHDPFADPAVQQRLQEQQASERQAHLAVVNARHPDWIDLRQTPEFAAWRTSLPAPAQALLASTWDSSVLTDAIADFKKHLAQRNASASASNERDKRLEAAVPATTGRATGAQAVDEDAAFSGGFNKARGKP